jgi:hypothetical protein
MQLESITKSRISNLEENRIFLRKSRHVKIHGPSMDHHFLDQIIQDVFMSRIQQ